MSLTSNVYQSAHLRPPKALAIERQELEYETRQAIAKTIQRPVYMVPKGWRKMAKFCSPHASSFNKNIVAYILDVMRERAGLEPAIKHWFNANIKGRI